VGVSVVNALSDWLKLKIWRDGKVHEMEFAAATRGPLTVTGHSNHRGTEVTFRASEETFGLVEFHYDIPPSASANCPS
jgi:DNA gyrase subunit B